MRYLILSVVASLAVSFAVSAAAQEPVVEEPNVDGFVLGGNLGVGFNLRDDYTLRNGTITDGWGIEFGLYVGYRFDFGLEPFVMGEFAFAGHEGFAPMFAGGVGWHVRAADWEPYIEVGIGNGLLAGAGVDYVLLDSLRLGVGARLMIDLQYWDATLPCASAGLRVGWLF